MSQVGSDWKFLGSLGLRHMLDLGLSHMLIPQPYSPFPRDLLSLVLKVNSHVSFWISLALNCISCSWRYKD